ncbi:ninein-like protein [Montipora foliosa]|uniref:ninein-like protein n=1 Tax=Montipora foliosa TaxID=591990 RepID=UPI0035F16173
MGTSGAVFTSASKRIGKIIITRSQIETVSAERDALKESVVKFTEEKDMLIVESVDTAQRLEKQHETKLGDQESVFSEKMQTMQQTLTEERDKVLHSANQQRSMLEESLHSTKSEEQRLRTKLTEAEEVFWFAFSEILRLEKALSDAQEKLIHSENVRERLEKELESLGDLSTRLAEVEKQQMLKQQQNQKNSKNVRELERINRELRDENDELRLQCEALTQQVNSSKKRRPSHRKRQDSQKVHRHGSVLSDYTKPQVVKRNKEGVTSTDDSDAADHPDGTRVPPVRVSGDGGSNEDADDAQELEEQRKVIANLESELEGKGRTDPDAQSQSGRTTNFDQRTRKTCGRTKAVICEFQEKVQQLGRDTIRQQEQHLAEHEAAINELKSEIESLNWFSCF